MGNGKSSQKRTEEKSFDNSNIIISSHTEPNIDIDSISTNDINSAPNYTYTLTNNNIVLSRGIHQNILMNEKYKKKRVTPKIKKQCTSPILCIIHLIDYHKNLFATGHEDGLINLWDINTFNDFKILKGHALNFKIRSLMHLPHVDNNLLISCSEDKTIKLWNINNGSLVRTIITTSNIIIMSHVKEYNPNILLTGHAFDYSIYMWDFTKDEANEQLVFTFDGHLNNVWSFLYIPEVKKNYFLSAGEDCTIILWDLETRAYVKIFDEHGSLITSMAYLGGMQFASASLDGKIKIWDLNVISSIKTITPNGSSLYSIKLLNNIVKDNLMICSSDNGLVLVNYNNQKIVKNIKTDYFMAPLTVIVNNNKYSFCSCSFSGEVLQLWDLE
jgi:WD40 repeat protein